MQKILLIDSAMSGCAAAYYDAAAQAFFGDYLETQRGQAEHLVPMVQGVLKQGAAAFEDLDAIVVVCGPGTFTGIRIGLSSARALGLALSLPVWGISTLQALALSYAGGKHGGEAMAVVETKREDFYVQSFDAQGTALDGARSMNAQDMPRDLPVFGDAAVRFAGLADGAVDVLAGYEVIDLEPVARAFCDGGQRGQYFTDDAQPIYLRGPDVSQPKAPPRVLKT